MSISYFGESSRNVNLVDLPDFCPRCHRNIDPKRRVGYFPRKHGDRADKQLELELVSQCTSSECGYIFISLYGAQGSTDYFSLKESYPSNFREKDFSNEIKSVSESFVDMALVHHLGQS